MSTKVPRRRRGSSSNWATDTTSRWLGDRRNRRVLAYRSASALTSAVLAAGPISYPFTPNDVNCGLRCNLSPIDAPSCKNYAWVLFWPCCLFSATIYVFYFIAVIFHHSNLLLLWRQKKVRRLNMYVMFTDIVLTIKCTSNDRPTEEIRKLILKGVPNELCSLLCSLYYGSIAIGDSCSVLLSTSGGSVTW